MDTGPKVQGRHVDLYMWSCYEALAFGRRESTSPCCASDGIPARARRASSIASSADAKPRLRATARRSRPTLEKQVPPSDRPADGD